MNGYLYLRKGDGSRCWRSSSKRCCYRSSRTSRGSGSGCSCHHSATRHHWSCSCSNPEGETPDRREHRTTGTVAPKLIYCDGLYAKGDASPLANPLKGVFGDGSRCWRSSTKRCSYRPRRTSRGTGSGSGRSRHHSTTRHHRRRSRSNHKCRLIHRR